MFQSIGGHVLPVIPKCVRCLMKDLTPIILHDKRAGDLVCGRCGSVLVDRLVDQGSETVSYDDEPDTSRFSDLKDLFGGCMTNFIGGSKEQIQKLERAQNLATNPRELTVLRNLHVLRDMAARLNVSSQITDAAIDLFSLAIVKNLPDLSSSKVNLAASCLYLACRQSGYARTLEEVSTVSNVDPKLISKLYMSLSQGLDIILSPIPPSSLIARISNHLNLSPSVIESSRQVCDYIAAMLEGRTPTAIAAVSIICACLIFQHRLDVNYLMTVSGTTIATCSNIYSLIYSDLAQFHSKDHNIPKKLDPSVISSLEKLPIRDKHVNSLSEGIESYQIKSDDAKRQIVVDNVSSCSSVTPNASNDLLACLNDRKDQKKRPRSILFTAHTPAGKDIIIGKRRRLNIS